MGGPGIGGPRKGMASYERKLNSEMAKHALILDAPIPDASEDETTRVRALIARNARSAEERAMFEEMLLGGGDVAKCSCGQTYVVQSLAADCERREHIPYDDAGEGDDDG